MLRGLLIPDANLMISSPGAVAGVFPSGHPITLLYFTFDSFSFVGGRLIVGVYSSSAAFEVAGGFCWLCPLSRFCSHAVNVEITSIRRRCSIGRVISKVDKL